MGHNNKLLPGVDQRQLREVGYRMRAQLALGNDTRFRWLCDRDSYVDGKPKWQPLLLSELGRLSEEQGPKKMRALAAKLCEERPPTDRARAMIREARRGAESSPAPLTEAVLETIRCYRSERPDVDDDLVAAALEEALLQLRGD